MTFQAEAGRADCDSTAGMVSPSEQESDEESLSSSRGPRSSSLGMAGDAVAGTGSRAGTVIRTSGRGGRAPLMDGRRGLKPLATA